MNMGVSYMIMLCTCADEGLKEEHEMCTDHQCEGDVWGNENKRYADKLIRNAPHTIKYVAKYITDKWDELVSDDIYWEPQDMKEE
tara:strand:+ start:4646 stop:4900 length:255 start_codon:yes stop_codon:yes gene_type:complete